MFKISSSDFRTMSMHRKIQTCTDEFLTVTEGVVYDMYKVVTWSWFGVTVRHKVSGRKWTFHHCVTTSHTNLT